MYPLLDPSRFVVFITGATSGFGEAAARRYVAAGGKVIATGRRQERLEKLQAELGAENCHIITLDVRDRAALEKAIADIPAPFDAINIVLANAGVGNAGTVAITPTEVLLRTIEINLNGVVRTVKAALPQIT